MDPGFRLRQIRDRLGLTYREVERQSYELAMKRGRPDFIMHISRLADIETRKILPTMHRLYTLGVLYHIDPLEIADWYGIPLRSSSLDEGRACGTVTGSATSPEGLQFPARLGFNFHERQSTYLEEIKRNWAQFEAILFSQDKRYLYGSIGLDDHTMEPLLNPGTVVLVDPALRDVDDVGWSNEYDRPIYFVAIGGRYWCGWCKKAGKELVLEPHHLSRAIPEFYQSPTDARVVGRVVGVAKRLGSPTGLCAKQYP
jgi:hypothetical protein